MIRKDFIHLEGIKKRQKGPPHQYLVKFPYSPILNYACKVINYACISFVYKDNRDSREDRIYTFLIILTYSPLWLL